MPETEKVYLKSKEVRKLLKKSTGWCKRRVWCRIYLPDKEYFLPPMEDVKRIVADSQVNKNRWTAESFDCDDFAKVLASEFALAAYKDGVRRAPYCMGVIWGHLPGPHAVNWVLTNDKKFWLIEPQNDGIYTLRKEHKKIWLMLS